MSKINSKTDSNAGDYTRIMTNENECSSLLTRVEKRAEGFRRGVEGRSKRPKNPMKGNPGFLPEHESILLSLMIF
jgi:hypothetical protein